MVKVIGRVPRGFTRFYVLHLLKERPMTGKEIIDEAEKQSTGVWRPSPGLIYPLLGRLVKGGLIEETERGRFTITPKGESALEKYTLIHEQLEGQLRIVRRLGQSIITMGKFLTDDALDRITSVTARVQETIGKSSRELQRSFYKNYRGFLEKELNRIEKMRLKEPVETEESS